ncbi:MAG: hypothetical protein IPP56_04885 [Bacteroidetes bacterium]|nr:hypothetical protein [Bacteroidota bacterium]MBK9673617.1 hypothetical protein [Bacteroidota bacterium]MBK9799080.1 hypothetical protein [Bacteroidota bacterium]MBP6414177.1 hypothetical protein [Bacteroidia bacterium]
MSNSKSKLFTVFRAIAFLLGTFILPALPSIAQQDYVETSNKKKSFYFTISQEQGLTINLAEKQNRPDYKQVATANLQVGLSAKLDYKNYFVSIGYFHHGYTVGVSSQDEAINTGRQHKSTSDFYAYKRIPLKLGYCFETGKTWLTVSPFIAENLLHSNRSGISFTSNGSGLSMSSEDTIFTTTQTSMARPYRKLFAPGAGILLCAGKNFFKISLLAEYFQASKNWTEIRDIYTRDSKVQGFYTHTEYYHSKARTINLSLLLSFRF